MIGCDTCGLAAGRRKDDRRGSMTTIRMVQEFNRRECWGGWSNMLAAPDDSTTVAS
jgi:hypothetical protein